MARPIIIGNPLSPHVRALTLALAEKDITFSIEGPLLARPRLQWGESQVEGALACLRHVDQAVQRAPLEPTDDARRASMNRALDLNYQEAVLTLGRQVAGPYILAIVIGAHAWPMPEEHYVAALRTVACLENELGNGPYFGGNSLSMADIAISALFEPLSEVPEYSDLVGPESPLRPWFERMTKRSAFEVTKQTGGSVASLYLAAV